VEIRLIWARGVQEAIWKQVSGEQAAAAMNANFILWRERGARARAIMIFILLSQGSSINTRKEQQIHQEKNFLTGFPTGFFHQVLACKSEKVNNTHVFFRQDIQDFLSISLRYVLIRTHFDQYEQILNWFYLLKNAYWFERISVFSKFSNLNFYMWFTGERVGGCTPEFWVSAFHVVDVLVKLTATYYPLQRWIQW